ncbi:5-amino-6-(5-phospho-D-ribitylamino)uracil phosphatase, chloroplastic [Nicotiana tabacum]|uniref:5-amino-6-(5-phospho-D-ribitylamino)uracil phosphatase, chloroplastic n=1 Tax=Nicotiana tabacum TaxID=4097 RepID=UPI003F4E8C87
MEGTLSFRSCSQAQLPLQPTSFPPQFPNKFQFLRVQKTKPLSSPQCYQSRRLVIRKALGTGDNGHFDDFPVTPNKIFMEEAIGAEYGEGFETFRPNGMLKVDVDFLNDRLQAGFLQRIRYAMKPDEAYGLIFSWDNVVADSGALKLDAWNQLASEEGLEIPEDYNVQRLLLYADADQVLDKVLLREKKEADRDRLKTRLSQIYYDNLLKISEPIEGLKEWLDAVSTARIPCAVVSSLDRRNMVEALERMGLMKYFQAIVTEEDGMESIAHRFLSAAVKLDRKPSKCVVFEDDPRGITAAHNCTMMAVALIGAHPAYDLGQADLAVGSFSELSVINLRRLYAHKGSNFMDLQKQIVEKTPRRRKLTIDTIF